MFNCSLALEMESYLEIRAAIVSKATTQYDRSSLMLLDKYLVEKEYSNKFLTEDILSGWIMTLDGKSKTVSEKIGSIRGFVKYLNHQGVPSFLPSPPRVKSSYIPYIFNDDEIATIMHLADNIEVKSLKGCSPYIQLKIPMILRILYGCGTRLGETVALQRRDIDFKNETLFWRTTKNSKERIVPVDQSLICVLEKYCCAIKIMDKPNAYLFPGAKIGTHLTKRQTLVWFMRILKLANIDQRKISSERGANLHCFRHLFVLKSMQKLESAGHPVDLNDLVLPTYLGHNCLIDTDQYMRFSGANVPQAIDAFERFTIGLIPKVEVAYEEK